MLGFALLTPTYGPGVKDRPTDFPQGADEPSVSTSEMDLAPQLVGGMFAAWALVVRSCQFELQCMRIG